MKLRLYVLPASHPCAAVRKALELKGLPYSVWEWPPPLHAPMQWLMTGQPTVPAMREGKRVIPGSRAIMHRLDELVAEPRLYPEDPDEYRRVEAADRWGDLDFQPIARELIWAGAIRRPDALASYAESSVLPVPRSVLRISAPLIIRAERRLNHTSDELAARRMRELPGHLDRIDAWLADGTLWGPDRPSGGDLQILSTVRLMSTFADVRPMLEGRPCLAAAMALWPRWGGELPAGALTAGGARTA